MIGGEKVLAVITARGGSKGVPRKNLRKVGGKPLIAWTIEAALRSRYLDKVVLSSEDAEIIQVAAEFGCEVPFVRPAKLAQDDTPGIDPVLDALERLPGYDLVVLLQPTSPLRIAEDIDASIRRCVDERAPACVSVTATSESPYWMFTLDDGKMRPLLGSIATPERRQDLPQAYSLNGAVYVARPQWLVQARSFLAEGTIAYLMPGERSVDVDEELDLKLVEVLLLEREQRKGPR